jgi:hypothetical protein
MDHNFDFDADVCQGCHLSRVYVNYFDLKNCETPSYAEGKADGMAEAEALSAAYGRLKDELRIANASLLMVTALLKTARLRAECAEGKIRKDAEAATRTNKRKGDVTPHTSWGSSPSELQFDKSAVLGAGYAVEPEPQADGFCLSTSVASASAGLMKAVRDSVQLDRDVIMYNEYVAKNYKTGPYHSFENWKRFVSDDAY